MNARPWPTLIISLLLVSNLAGCAFPWTRKTEKPVEISTVPLEKTPLALPAPDPMRIKPIEWLLVTPANSEQAFKNLDAKGQDQVIFGLTDDGYQQLAITIAELRNFINTQRNIIIKYKEYYEPVKKEEPKKP